MKTNIGKKAMPASLAVVMALSVTPAQAFAEGSQGEEAAVAATQTEAAAEAEEDYVSIKINGHAVQLKKEASASIPKAAGRDQICYILWNAFLVNPDDYENYVRTSEFSLLWEAYITGDSSMCYGGNYCWVSVSGNNHAIRLPFGGQSLCTHPSLGMVRDGDYRLRVAGQEFLFTKVSANGGEAVVNPDGSTTTTVTEEDGSSVVTTVSQDGSIATVVEKNSHGCVTHIGATVSDSSEAVASGNVVELPMEPVEAVASKEAVEIELFAPAGTKVSIPVAKAEGLESVGNGAVLVKVGADGSEAPMPKTAVADSALISEVPGDCVLKVVDGSVGFPDVSEDDWFAGAVDFTSARGILSGVVAPDGSVEFRGDAQTTRGMFVTMLSRMELGSAAAAAGGVPSFGDVADDDWYAGAAAWAAEEGLLTGYVLPDGTKAFGGDDPVTREQVAVFLMRYAEWLGMDTSARAESTAPDASEVSDWAADAVSWAVAEGYILGDEDTGAVCPADSATRAEAAAIVMRFVNSLY